uniref:ribosomal protein S14 n=1 Tax=Glaucosphaera vacuolata TaxID=38265 RepID=UPI001FCCF639|nr:ribosomal protein S14 [Glaucosphaera vacuolata]UNJ18707.1 ribosomal protein S14 [Glaucosphaera vacuolata]
MLEREKKRQHLSQKFKEKRKELKIILKSATSIEEKLSIHGKLQSLPRDSASCRKRNRCWLTGRSRGYYRDFGLSRHVFREMSHECLLPGITKSSW